MNIKTDTDNLKGRCIVAMPSMADPRFAQSVVFICAHSSEGAMGLIVNKPVEDVKLTDLLSQMSIETKSVDPEVAVHFGGPVEAGRGFVLHGSDYCSELSNMKITDDFSVTSTMDILEDVSVGRGPKERLFALGYAGWSAGQLEQEIADNAWLVTPSDPELLFATKDDKKWSGALRLIGIDPAILSSSGGRA